MAKQSTAKIDYSYWKSQEGVEVIGQWKRNGLTNNDICEKLGINDATLYRWKKENATLSDSLKYSKDIADTRVENALFEQCMKGNMQAIYFYLLNRKPQDYRARQEIAIDSIKEETVKEIKALADKLTQEN